MAEEGEVAAHGRSWFLVLGSWFCRRHPDKVGGWFFVLRFCFVMQKKNPHRAA
jgi:hypothetical protein